MELAPLEAQEINEWGPIVRICNDSGSRGAQLKRQCRSGTTLWKIQIVHPEAKMENPPAYSGLRTEIFSNREDMIAFLEEAIRELAK